MNETPNMLEKAFDLLSSVPYLKTILFASWVFSTVFLGSFLLLTGLDILTGSTGSAEINTVWISKALQWIVVNPFFAWIFFLWKKREKQHTSIRNKK